MNDSKKWSFAIVNTNLNKFIKQTNIRNQYQTVYFKFQNSINLNLIFPYDYDHVIIDIIFNF